MEICKTCEEQFTKWLLIQARKDSITKTRQTKAYELYVRFSIEMERNRSKAKKSSSTVIGAGYIPYIDKDKHEPETMAEMITAER